MEEALESKGFHTDGQEQFIPNHIKFQPGWTHPDMHTADALEAGFKAALAEIGYVESKADRVQKASPSETLTKILTSELGETLAPKLVTKHVDAILKRVSVEIPEFGQGFGKSRG